MAAKEDAPAVGETMVFDAGEAGSVEVMRSSETELTIVSTQAADGWTAETTAPRGSRVKVRFINTSDTHNKVRWTATMDQKGTRIHVKYTPTTC